MRFLSGVSASKQNKRYMTVRNMRDVYIHARSTVQYTKCVSFVGVVMLLALGTIIACAL